MMHLWQRLLSVVGLGRARKEVVTPAEFTHQFCRTMRAQHPEVRVMIIGDLELMLQTADNTKAHVYLNNTYVNYQQDSMDLPTLIQRMVQSHWASLSPTDKSMTRDQIVPVIKSHQWIVSARQDKSRDGKTPPEPYFEVLNDELIVMYVIDSPSSMRFVTPDLLAEHQIAPAEVRTLAVANLRRLLPKIAYERVHGSFIITAGGNYEASLILFDELWPSKDLSVRGEPVMAIPTRSILLAAGSQDAMAIAVLKSMAAENYQTQPYNISDKLFIRRAGQIEIFEG